MAVELHRRRERLRERRGILADHLAQRLGIARRQRFVDALRQVVQLGTGIGQLVRRRKKSLLGIAEALGHRPRRAGQVVPCRLEGGRHRRQRRGDGSHIVGKLLERRRDVRVVVDADALQAVTRLLGEAGRFVAFGLGIGIP